MSFEALNLGIFKAGKAWCAAAWTPQGLCAFVLPQRTREIALRQLHAQLPPLPEKVVDQPLRSVPSLVQKEARKGLSGRRYRPIQLDLFYLTSFQQKVMKATCQIPWGQVRTYGWVAQRVGAPRGYRAAGQALNKSPIGLLVPCHRVIAEGNRLGGYGGELNWKIRLLRAEKVRLLTLPDGSYKVSLL